MYTFFNYLWSFTLACTASWGNLKACLPVWEYMPAYYRDYVEFKTNGPYYHEKEAIKNDKNV